MRAKSIRSRGRSSGVPTAKGGTQARMRLMVCDRRTGSRNMTQPFGANKDANILTTSSRRSSTWCRNAADQIMSNCSPFAGNNSNGVSINVVRAVSPCWIARCWHTRIAPGEMSTPVTSAPQRANSNEFSPSPQPTSRTRLPLIFPIREYATSNGYSGRSIAAWYLRSTTSISNRPCVFAAASKNAFSRSHCSGVVEGLLVFSMTVFSLALFEALVGLSKLEFCI